MNQVVDRGSVSPYYRDSVGATHRRGEMDNSSADFFGHHPFERPVVVAGCMKIESNCESTPNDRRDAQGSPITWSRSTRDPNPLSVCDLPTTPRHRFASLQPNFAPKCWSLRASKVLFCFDIIRATPQLVVRRFAFELRLGRHHGSPRAHTRRARQRGKGLTGRSGAQVLRRTIIAII